MKNFRHWLIAGVTFIGGLYFFLEFVIPSKEVIGFEFGKFHEEILRGLRIFGAMTIGLGLINILKVHGTKILKAQRGWGNSLALLLGLFCILTIEGLNYVTSEDSVSSWKKVENLELFAARIQADFETDKVAPLSRVDALRGALGQITEESKSGHGFLAEKSTDAKFQEASEFFLASIADCTAQTQLLHDTYLKVLRGEEHSVEAATQTLIVSLKKASEHARGLANLHYENSLIKKLSSLFFQGFLVPLGASMFSLLAFYIAVAAYRTFRVKSMQAFIMMLSATLVILGQVPQGEMYISEYLPAVREWILNNISTPAFRAITFGSLIAGLSMAVRIWLSLEQSPLSAGFAEGSPSKSSGGKRN